MPRLLTFKEEQILPAQKVLIFGGPKVGKTQLAGTLADEYKLLWFDLEKGIATLYSTCDDGMLSNIEYVPVPDTPTNPVADKLLLRAFEQRKGFVCSEHTEWNCARCTKKEDNIYLDLDECTPENKWIIVIDSGTQFGHSAYNYICNTNSISLEDGEKATFTIWGVMGAHIDKLFGMVQNSNNHVLLLAHEMEVELPDKTKRLVPSMGTRKVASTFGKYFDHVIRLSRSGLKHKANSTTTGQANVESGSRWDLDINDPDTKLHHFFELPADHAEKRKARKAKSAVTPKLNTKRMSLNK